MTGTLADPVRTVTGLVGTLPLGSLPLVGAPPLGSLTGLLPSTPSPWGSSREPPPPTRTRRARTRAPGAPTSEGETGCDQTPITGDGAPRAPRRGALGDAMLIPPPLPAYTLAPELELSPRQHRALERCLDALTGKVGGVVVLSARTEGSCLLLELAAPGGSVLYLSPMD